MHCDEIIDPEGRQGSLTIHPFPGDDCRQIFGSFEARPQYAHGGFIGSVNFTATNDMSLVEARQFMSAFSVAIAWVQKQENRIKEAGDAG